MNQNILLTKNYFILADQYYQSSKLLLENIINSGNMTFGFGKSEKEAEENMQKVNIVYEVDASDLKVYQNSGSYNPGKVNPFANTSEDTSGTDNPQSGNSQSGSNTQTGGGTGNYYPSTGGK